ncbi:MAG TPA: SDR family NAD(P)-dependent oxidoreductase [Acidimicrobiales bacterium]|jgi:NAD(P)-dependent dehydrogenase (short-subunit alcohol dehydrogenase family)|nr:SDR family NAD(P)-dependent oxidoreductase [Acidimicrobiales bacterium]
MDRLDGRVAIVTGASTGIGRSLAADLSRRGMRVVLVSQNQDRLDAAVTGTGGEAIGVCADLAHPDAIDRIVDATIARFGTVHVVVNNAGVFAPGYSWQLDHEEWDWVMKVNLLSPIRLVNRLLPVMMEQPEGHVVNVASVGGLLGVPAGHGPYGASKHGLVGFSKALRADLALRAAPIGVTCVCPGAVASAITTQLATNGPDGVPRADRELPSEIRAVLDQVNAATDAGIAPDDVAPMIVDAILTNRFWLLPNGERFLKGVERELAEMRG